MPDVIVIAGPNGAGKSTLAPYLLRDAFGIVEYVNADTIAQGLTAFAPEKAAFEAGKIMLRRLNELAAQKKDFAFETTLSARSYARWLGNLQNNAHLVYLWLNSAELAVERVRERVRLGGHDIPMEIIHRRYGRGLKNFFETYRSLVDSWQLVDTFAALPREVAYGDKIASETILDSRIWKQIAR